MLKRILILVFFISLLSCKSIYVDYDSDRDFSNYTTYNYYENLESGLKEFDESRVKRAIDNSMRDKGFTMSMTPDIWISFYALKSVKHNQSYLDFGVGQQSGNFGFGMNTQIPIHSQSHLQNLGIDIIDVKSKHVIWQSSGQFKWPKSKNLSIREASYDKNIQKLLKTFPPQTNN